MHSETDLVPAKQPDILELNGFSSLPADVSLSDEDDSDLAVAFGSKEESKIPKSVCHTNSKEGRSARSHHTLHLADIVNKPQQNSDLKKSM